MVDNETVGKRIAALIQELGLTKNAFALSLEKTATVIQHLVDERNKPGFDLMCKIFEIYPNVSKDWLLEGSGPMMRTPASPKPPSPTAEEAEMYSAPPAPAAATTTSVPATPTPPSPAAVPSVASNPDAAAWQATLYTQQMAHQLALAELRNQHLQEQQRLMQQMLDLLQRRS